MFTRKLVQHRVITKKSQLIHSRARLFSSQVDVDWESAKPYDTIPGPKNTWELLRLLGPGGRYQNLPMNKLLECYRKDFGTLARFPGVLGQRPMIMTFLPEDVEKVLRTEGKFPFRRPFDSMVYFRKKLRPDLYPAGAGLIVTQGEEWYDFRSKVQQVLMQPRATKVYVPGIDDVARDFVDKIREIRDNKGETPENFTENLNDWALESIAFIALDARLGIIKNPEHSKLNQLIKEFFECSYNYDIMPSIWRFYKTPGFKKFIKVYEDINEIIMKYISDAIERYEKNPTPSDHESGVLEKLIKIDRNIGITTAEDMLFAGVDTTSTAITSILYCLAKNPDKQEILRQEVFQILPEKDSKLTASSMNNIPYLRAVVKESLRLYPVTNGNVRATGQDIVMQGYQIPKGVDILLSNSVLSLDEEHFKESQSFIPERWLKSNTDPQCPHAKDAHPFAYLPFGFGSRMCIGRRFTELEMEVLTIRIIREFRLEWPHEDLKFKSVLLNGPDGPLKFKMTDI